MIDHRLAVILLLVTGCGADPSRRFAQDQEPVVRIHRGAVDMPQVDVPYPNLSIPTLPDRSRSSIRQSTSAEPWRPPAGYTTQRRPPSTRPPWYSDPPLFSDRHHVPDDGFWDSLAFLGKMDDG